MQYFTRLQAERNIAFQGYVAINLIFNTSKVQYLLHYIHYTCIQNCVRDLKTQTMHSSKIMLNYQQRKSLWQSILGYSACMHSRTTTLLARNLRTRWVMATPEDCSYLQVNVQDWLAPSLLNNTGSIYTDTLEQWHHFRITFVQIYTLSIAWQQQSNTLQGKLFLPLHLINLL